MYHQYRIITLLFFFLSTIVPSAHTQPTNNIASIIPSSIQTSPAINAVVTCTPFKPFHFRPNYQDCSAAIRSLPNSPQKGTFHTGGVADGFKLPVNEIEKTCEIKVELIDSYKGGVMGTWRDVRDLAARVADECYNGHGMEHTGGAILLEGTALISLVRAGSAIVSGVENSTIAGEN